MQDIILASYMLYDLCRAILAWYDALERWQSLASEKFLKLKQKDGGRRNRKRGSGFRVFLSLCMYDNLWKQSVRRSSVALFLFVYMSAKAQPSAAPCGLANAQMLR
jgi:hypothetical protein